MGIEQIEKRGNSIEIGILGNIGYDPRAKKVATFDGDTSGGLPIGGLSGYLAMPFLVGGEPGKAGAVSVGPQLTISKYWGRTNGMSDADDFNGEIALRNYPGPQDFSGLELNMSPIVDVFLGKKMTLRTSVGPSITYEDGGTNNVGLSGSVALVAEIVNHFSLLALLSGDFYNMNRNEQVSFGIGASASF